MTTEEKAKAYDEAIERARRIKNGEDNWRYSDLIEIIPALEEVLPELKESEDERIRKEMVKHFEDTLESRQGIATSEQVKSWLAWLEKQKINTEGDFGRGYDCGYQAGYAVAMNEMKPKVATATLDSEQKEPHYTKRNALFDECVKNCDPEIMKKVSDEIDAMLGKPSCWNSPVMTHEMIMDEQKEQKPTEWSEDFDKEVENIHKRYPEVSYAKLTRIAYHFSKWANRRKDMEWSEIEVEFRGEKVKVKRPFFRDDKGRGYSTTEQDDEVTWNALRAWCEKHGYTPFDLYPQQQWSEEDERITNALILELKTNPSVATTNGYKRTDYIDWLKSFRPSWKPSEEQMAALVSVTKNLFAEMPERHRLESLHSDLKKL